MKRQWISLLGLLQGLPPISTSRINAALIRKYVGKINPVILEIGCNNGGHTRMFLNTFADPQIYCFEPDPRAIERFKQKIGQLPNVHLFEVALSDSIGRIEFYQSGGKESSELPGGWDKSGSIRKPKDHLSVHPSVRFEHSILVNTTTLDAWCVQESIGQIDFIWMDVQGAEMDVLRGGVQALRQTRFLYTEYDNLEMYAGQSNLKQLLNYLTKFKVLIRYPKDVLLKNLDFAT